MEASKRATITTTGVAGAALLALVSVNAQFIAKKVGADAWGYDVLVWIGSRMAGPVMPLVIIILAGMATGAAIFAWSDYLWRRWSDRLRGARPLSFKPADRKLFAMTLVVIFGSCLALSAIWLAAERFLISSPLQKQSAANVEPGATKSSNGPNSPLAKAVESFLATQGKIPKWNRDAAGLHTVGLASDGPPDTEFISLWDASLGPWPTMEDGFTERQLRRSPFPIHKNLSRPLLPRDAEIKQQKIDHLLRVLRTDMQPTIDDGPRLQTNWMSGVRTSYPEYWRQLTAYRERLEANHVEFERLRVDSADYEDMAVTADQPYWNDVVQRVDRFRIAINYAGTQMKPDAVGEAMQFFLKEPSEGFGKAISIFTEWRNITIIRLSTIRRQTSQ